ncbi:pumilio-family RNA binding repeat containing protein [Aphelenchoides avenae]|nr:pumilio-family RNA binding repeat containing protein [Aphelenchus avenae]
MDKFGSNVVEKALKVAPAKSFSTICQKLFEDPEKSTPSNMDARLVAKLHKDPLDELIFHKYGNYVIQAALEESSRIVGGVKHGDPQWFFLLEKRIRKAQERLARFSSGKRLLQILKMARRNYSVHGNNGRRRNEFSAQNHRAT